MRRFWVGLLTGVVATVVIALGVVFSGVIDMSAASGSGALGSIGHVMWQRSLAWRADDARNPLTGEAAAQAGLEHYADSCVLCHGAPNVPRAELANGLEPAPPDLHSERTQSRSDGELFRIVHSGVQMTGMPAFGGHHDEREIWEMVAVIRQLDSLPEAAEQRLRERTRSRHQHGGGGDHHVAEAGHHASDTSDAERPEPAPQPAPAEEAGNTEEGSPATHARTEPPGHEGHDHAH